MAIHNLFTRLAFAGTLVFAGASTISSTPSGASGAVGPSGHPGRVLYPTIAQARANRSLYASRVHGASTSIVLSAHGGLDGIEVTTGAPKVYLVFYGSQWGTAGTDSSGNMTFSGDPSAMAPRVQELMKGLGTNNELWSGVMTQYCNGVPSGTTTCPSGGTHAGYPTGGALGGVWYDNSVASPSSATGNQLATEAVRAAGYFGNTDSTLNRSAQYVIVSPTGTHPDGFNTPNGNFCAWHDYNGDTTLSGGAATSNYGDIAFTNLPYITDMGASCGANYVNSGSAGLLDGVTIVEGHEYAETLTDQNAGYGYYDNTTGEENGDACAWVGTGGSGGAQNVTFATGSYPMQATWSNANSACEISGPIEGTSMSTNDFSLSVNPTSSSVVQGSSTSATISTSIVSGTAQSVSLGVTGLPSGVTATFSPSSVTSGGSATLTIQAGSGTLPGTYPLTITGTAASGTHSVLYTLTVNAAVAATFTLATTPTSGKASFGHPASTSVVTTNVSGTPQTVSLSVSGLPSGVVASFSPSALQSGSSSTLTFSLAKRTKSGTYIVTITGTANSMTASTSYQLSI